MLKPIITMLPTLSLLTNNGPPTALEKQAAQDIIPSIKVTIAEIDEELTRLNLVKTDLQHAMHQQEAALSPFRRVPTEILRENMQNVVPNRNPVDAPADLPPRRS